MKKLVTFPISFLIIYGADSWSSITPTRLLAPASSVLVVAPVLAIDSRLALCNGLERAEERDYGKLGQIE